jgi:TatA/E family protein of Tat protein translocase
LHPVQALIAPRDLTDLEGAGASTLKGVFEGLFSPMHLLVIMVVALLVFGPNKLPEIGRQVGRALQELRRVQASLTDEMHGAFAEDPPDPPSAPPALPTPASPTLAAASPSTPGPAETPAPAPPTPPPANGAPPGTAQG